MICALRSSLFRLVKTGLLAKVLVFSVIAALGVVFHTFMFDLWMFTFSRPRFLDNTFLMICCCKLTVVFPFALMVFCSVFTGSDVAYRAVNNKIATGLSRFSVYMADLIVSVFATALSAVMSMSAVYVFAKTFPVKENIRINADILKIAGSAILICISFTAFYEFLQFFLSTKLLFLIISGLTVLALMMSTSAIRSMLDEPYRNYVMTDKEKGTYEWVINKEYIGGAPRTVLSFIQDASVFNSGDPFDDDILIKKDSAACAVILLSTAAGIVSVNKKEYP